MEMAAAEMMGEEWSDLSQKDGFQVTDLEHSLLVWSWGWTVGGMEEIRTPKMVQTVAVALGCIPEADGKSLLQKTTHNSDTEHRI